MIFRKQSRWQIFMSRFRKVTPLPTPDKSTQREIERADWQARYISRLRKVG